MATDLEKIKPLLRAARANARAAAEHTANLDDLHRLEAWGRFCAEQNLQLLTIAGQLVWSEWHRAWESAAHGRRINGIERTIIISTSAIDACAEVADVLAQTDALPAGDEWESWRNAAGKCAAVVAAHKNTPTPPPDGATVAAQRHAACDFARRAVESFDDSERVVMGHRGGAA